MALEVISFPNDDYVVTLTAGTRIRAMTPEGDVQWLVLTSQARVRLVPEEGTTAQFVVLKNSEG